MEAFEMICKGQIIVASHAHCCCIGTLYNLHPNHLLKEQERHVLGARGVKLRYKIFFVSAMLY